MATKLYPYDPAEDLTSEQAIAQFIALAFETGDPDYIAHAKQVVDRARKIISTGGSKRTFPPDDISRAT
jgi:DNA-binding phage protein